MKKTEKFADGLVWNYVTPCFLRQEAFFLSIIIAVFYDEEVLGSLIRSLHIISYLAS